MLVGQWSFSPVIVLDDHITCGCNMLDEYAFSLIKYVVGILVGHSLPYIPIPTQSIFVDN